MQFTFHKQEPRPRKHENLPCILIYCALVMLAQDLQGKYLSINFHIVSTAQLMLQSICNNVVSLYHITSVICCLKYYW